MSIVGSLYPLELHTVIVTLNYYTPNPTINRKFISTASTSGMVAHSHRSVHMPGLCSSIKHLGRHLTHLDWRLTCMDMHLTCLDIQFTCLDIHLTCLHGYAAHTPGYAALIQRLAHTPRFLTLDWIDH